MKLVLSLSRQCNTTTSLRASATHLSGPGTSCERQRPTLQIGTFDRSRQDDVGRGVCVSVHLSTAEVSGNRSAVRSVQVVAARRNLDLRGPAAQVRQMVDAVAGGNAAIVLAGSLRSCSKCLPDTRPPFAPRLV